MSNGESTPGGFVVRLLLAAAGNAGDGKDGGTTRVVPDELRDREREIASAARALKVGFMLTSNFGNLALTISNDQRAIDALGRLPASELASRSPADRLKTGPTGGRSHESRPASRPVENRSHTGPAPQEAKTPKGHA